jgi:hypothetical protein
MTNIPIPKINATFTQNLTGSALRETGESNRVGVNPVNIANMLVTTRQAPKIKRTARTARVDLELFIVLQPMR